MGKHIEKSQNKIIFVKRRPIAAIAFGIFLEAVGVLCFLLLLIGYIFSNVEVTSVGLFIFSVGGMLFLFFGVRLTSSRWGQEFELDTNRMIRWRSNLFGHSETFSDCDPLKDKEILIFMPKHTRYPKYSVYLIGSGCEEHLFVSPDRETVEEFLQELKPQIDLPTKETIKEYLSLEGYFRGDREWLA